MTITTPAFSLRSGYITQVRIAGPPAGFLTSTYSPWRGLLSSAALACDSEAGTFSWRALAGAEAAGAGGVCGAAGGGVCEGGAWGDVIRRAVAMSGIHIMSLLPGLPDDLPPAVCNSEKRVYDLQSVNFAPCLKIFREENGASGPESCSHHQGVPKGELVESVKVDCGKDVFKPDPKQVEATEELRFPLCIFRLYAEFFRCCPEVLLKDLSRNYACSLTPEPLDDLQSSGLFRRSVSVVCVDEDVGV